MNHFRAVARSLFRSTHSRRWSFFAFNQLSRTTVNCRRTYPWSDKPEALAAVLQPGSILRTRPGSLHTMILSFSCGLFSTATTRPLPLARASRGNLLTKLTLPRLCWLAKSRISALSFSIFGTVAKMQKGALQERLNGLVEPFNLSKTVSKSVFATVPPILRTIHEK
jgi:hypothetical protein